MRFLLPLLLAACWSAAIAQDTPKIRTVVKLSAKTQSGEVVAEALVDTQDAPDLAAWGKKAGGLCLEWLPKITALLPSDGFVPPKTVTLYFDPVMKGVAHADKSRITISASYARAHQDDLGMVVHELTHLVQAYPKPADGFTKPGWLVEGIADYIRLYHFEPAAPRPRVNPDKASYRDSYKTTAAFLAWLEQRNAGVVRNLNRTLREGRFKEDQFQEYTGKPLDELWRDFADSLRKKAESGQRSHGSPSLSFVAGPHSLAHGFSRVTTAARWGNRFNGFPLPVQEAAEAAAVRCAANTRLKPGANERAARTICDPATTPG